MRTTNHSSRFIEQFDSLKKTALSEIAADWDKGQAFKKECIVNEGNTPCIHYGELFKYGSIIDTILSWTNESPIKSSAKGDILFPASDVTPNGLARCSALMSEGVLLGGDIIVLRLKSGFIPEFVSYAINMQKDQLIRRVTGSVVRHMSAKSLNSVEIPIPAIADQKQFIDIIRQADKSKFGDFKSRFIEMFSSKQLPLKHLPDISENLDKKRVPITSGDRKSGKYPYYGASGIVDYVDDYIFDETLLLISEDGANLKDRVTPIAFQASGQFWVNNHAHVLRFDSSATMLYVEYLINGMDIEKYLTGMAQPKLNQKELNAIPIPFPSESDLHRFQDLIIQADKSKYLN